MTEKIKLVVNKKTPKGIVIIFGNIQNKIGTYDREKIEELKNKLKEKTIELGEKIIITMDNIDDVIFTAADKLFDKAIKSYDELKMRNDSQNDSTIENNIEEEVQEIDEPTPVPKIMTTRSINFEDLEPLGKIIDEEDDIHELQELKMELLFREQKDKYSKESDITRKK